METQKAEEKNKHKVLIGFKCNPALKLILCNQAQKLGITLSSHVELLLATYDHKEDEAGKESEQIKKLKDRLAFYEESYLKELYSDLKGKKISYTDKKGQKVSLTIDSIQDVFTVVINSFKTTK